MNVLERFRERDPRALSRAISIVENRREGFRELLGGLYAEVGRALRIGVTGPPGAGKSTLVNCLVHEFIGQGKKVGVIAVDPSSPFTGGALLGDRVRMHEFPSDGSVFFRSMATRGATGGLSASTENVAVLLDAFGFDVTLIETVGVGQVELEIVDACDTVVVAVVPESGDAVQTMKAGLMEIADIMVVNKADRPGSETMAADLRMNMKMRKSAEGAWRIPIVSTEAVNRKNIDKLFSAMGKHVEFRRETGQFDEHRRNQLRKKILNIIRFRFQREFLDRIGEETPFADIINDIHNGRTNPYRVAGELYEKFARG